MTRIAIAAIAVGSMFSVASADTILATFGPQTNPPSGNPPELVFASNTSPPPSLGVGSGSIGDGDGGSLSNGLAPGLILNTPLTISPGTSLGQVNQADGSTTFYDVTLSLTGNAASGPAVNLGGGFLFQPLGAGTFAFYGSKVGGGPGVLLLSGNLMATDTSGINVSGSVISDQTAIHYTGGAIYNQLAAQNGGTTGSESISLLNIAPPLTINSNTGYLSDFSADATGQFAVIGGVPEPASLGLLALGGLSLLARRRRA